MKNKTQYNNRIGECKEKHKPQTTTPTNELPIVIRHIIVGENKKNIQQEIQPEIVFSYGITLNLRTRDIINGLKYILKNYKIMMYPSNYKAWTPDQLKLSIKYWQDPSSAVRCWLGVEE